MFERFFLSADLGDGGAGGGDPGGGAAVADAGAAPGGEGGGGQPSQPFDYEGFAKQYGGPEGLQRAVQFASDIQNRAHYNPQFKETLDRALRGEFGPAAQQQAQQQQNGQQPQQQGGEKPWLKYEPATMAQMQAFHRDLQRAKESGDPESVKAVFDDPMNAQAKEAYLAHQNEMNNAYWNPRDHYSRMWSDPENKQARDQEYQQAIQAALEPIQTELWNHQKMSFYQQHQKEIDSLPDNIRQAFERGMFGPYQTGAEWIKAAQGAIQAAKQFQQQPQAPVSGNETPETPRQPNSRPATNGVKREEQPRDASRDAAKKYAEDMRKARQLDKS